VNSVQKSFERMVKQARQLQKLTEPVEAALKLQRHIDDMERLHKMIEPPALSLAGLRVFTPPAPPDGHLASGFYERLVDWITGFEESLDADHEIGARLVAFGPVVIRLTDITWWNPALIRFDGVDDAGNPVQLIQHISQISVLLVRLPKQGQVARRIGFVRPPEPDAE